MDAAPNPTPGRIAGPSPTRWVWRGGMVLLFAWQAWLTLGLFGQPPFPDLFNDQPIVSGSHPQHLYLGALGAKAIATRGRTVVYDHAFQAGYPKTPIFDGSRLAELCLLIGGGEYRPVAYKLGIVAICMLVPLLLLIACFGIRLDSSATFWAMLLGQFVWWGPLGRNALEAGESELFIAALSGLAHVGLLVRFHRCSCGWSWLGLLATGALGWFLQPLLFPIALPLLLAYYLSVGTRHDLLTWHPAFWAAELGAMLLNLPWLIDWVSYWWLRAPLPTAAAVLPHRTMSNVWNAPLWGSATDRTLAVFLILSGAIGIVLLNRSPHRPASRLLGMGAGGALILALLGISWEPIGAMGTAALLGPALWYACPPAAHAWTRGAQTLWNWNGWARGVLIVLIAGNLTALLLFSEAGPCCANRFLRTTPLQIGLGSRRAAIVEEIRSHTTTAGRILWEDRAGPRTQPRWAALLPRLTGRSFIGGLDPDGIIEHSSLSLLNETLEQRLIASWSNEELAEYCVRYNVRWIVAWSPNVRDRMDAWPGVEKIANLHDDVEGTFYRLKNPPPGFTLRGKADILDADSQFITLGNVIPENGVVVLSLHYQAGLRASPDRVRVERETSGEDMIGFVRLRLSAPADRVTLSWER